MGVWVDGAGDARVNGLYTRKDIADGPPRCWQFWEGAESISKGWQWPQCTYGRYYFEKDDNCAIVQAEDEDCKPTHCTNCGESVTIAIGDKVDAAWHPWRDEWYPATIKADNGDDTYRIEYDDAVARPPSDQQARYPAKRIRLNQCKKCGSRGKGWKTGIRWKIYPPGLHL